MDLCTTWNVYRLSPIKCWPDNGFLGASDVPRTAALFSAWLRELGKTIIRTHLDTTSVSLWQINKDGCWNVKKGLPFKMARRYFISLNFSGLTFPVDPRVSKTSFRRRARISGCSASIVTANVVKPAVCQRPFEYTQTKAIQR